VSEAAGSPLVVIDPTPMVRQVLRITGLLDIFGLT
jgi:anti-anti-sigma regulatory factor